MKRLCTSVSRVTFALDLCMRAHVPRRLAIAGPFFLRCVRDCCMAYVLRIRDYVYIYFDACTYAKGTHTLRCAAIGRDRERRHRKHDFVGGVHRHVSRAYYYAQVVNRPARVRTHTPSIRTCIRDRA